MNKEAGCVDQKGLLANERKKQSSEVFVKHVDVSNYQRRAEVLFSQHLGS